MNNLVYLHLTSGPHTAQLFASPGQQKGVAATPSWSSQPSFPLYTEHCGHCSHAYRTCAGTFTVPASNGPCRTEKHIAQGLEGNQSRTRSAHQHHRRVLRRVVGPDPFPFAPKTWKGDSPQQRFEPILSQWAVGATWRLCAVSSEYLLRENDTSVNNAQREK